MNGEMTRAGTSRATGREGERRQEGDQAGLDDQGRHERDARQAPTKDAPVQTAAMSIVLRMTG